MQYIQKRNALIPLSSIIFQARTRALEEKLAAATAALAAAERRAAAADAELASENNMSEARAIAAEKSAATALAEFTNVGV
jgi:multidrug resistance efflux pump